MKTTTNRKTIRTETFERMVSYAALCALVTLIVTPAALVALIVSPFVLASYAGIGIVWLFTKGPHKLNRLIDASGIDQQYTLSLIVIPQTQSIDVATDATFCGSFDGTEVVEPTTTEQTATAEPTITTEQTTPKTTTRTRKPSTKPNKTKEASPDYATMTVKTLRVLAVQRGIKGCHKMRKADLIEAMATK